MPQVEDLSKFRDWPEDPTDRPMGPLRFVERDIEGATFRILQTWVFRQFNDEFTKAVSKERPRGVQRRGETGWFDVPLELMPPQSTTDD